tara:strand:- start:231 stop:515 length:285 start_codon:yes stop_codon:yes gene_type:complete
MARKIRKLTPSVLRRIVLEEKARLMETSDPVAAGVEDVEKVNAAETDADDLANTLEKDIDHLKVLKVHEQRLRKKLRRIQEARRKVRQNLLRKL